MLRIFSKKSKIFSYSHSRLYKNISGQLALVTGGTDGLGKEICIKLADKGCNIAVADIEGGCDFADELQREYLIKAKFFPVDIKNFNNVRKLKEQIESDLGPVDILVNNAETKPIKSTVHESTREEIKNVIQLNILSHFWTIKAFIKTMKERGTGHIVAISSLAGVFPVPKTLDYCATQYAVRGLMEALKEELETEEFHNIYTTVVFPAFLEADANYLTLVNEIDYLRVFPTSNTNIIAEHVIDSILRNEFNAYVPKWAPRYLRFSKWLPNRLSRRFGPPKPKITSDDDCECP